MKYAPEDRVRARSGLKPGDLDVTKPVISKMWLEGFYPWSTECVGISLPGSSKVVGINRTIIAQHFSVADRHRATNLALSFQPAPPDHVLTHVIDKDIWLWFG